MTVQNVEQSCGCTGQRDSLLPPPPFLRSTESEANKLVLGHSTFTLPCLTATSHSRVT